MNIGVMQQHFEVRVLTIARGLTTVSIYGLAVGGVGAKTLQWHRSTSQGFTPSGGTALSGKTAAQCDDTGLTTGTAYYYRVVVTDAYGVVITSAEVKCQVLRLVVCDGNSLTRGFGVSATFDFPTRLLQLVADIAVVNIGVDGQTTPDMLSTSPAKWATYYQSGMSSILVAWELTNDISVLKATGVQAYNHMVTLLTGARSSGWKAVVLTGSPRVYFSPFNPDFETDRIACNSLVRANWVTFADALVDIGLDPYLGLPGAYLNTDYYNVDQVHMTVAGYSLVPQLVAAGIVGL